MCSSTTQGQTYLCSSHGRWVCAVSRRSDRDITRLGSCDSYRLGGSVVPIRFGDFLRRSDSDCLWWGRIVSGRFGDFLRRRDCDSYRIPATISLRRSDSLGFGDRLWTCLR